jgi:hypothetical protein
MTLAEISSSLGWPIGLSGNCLRRQLARHSLQIRIRGALIEAREYSLQRLV